MNARDIANDTAAIAAILILPFVVDLLSPPIGTTIALAAAGVFIFTVVMK